MEHLVSQFHWLSDIASTNEIESFGWVRRLAPCDWPILRTGPFDYRGIGADMLVALTLFISGTFSRVQICNVNSSTSSQLSFVSYLVRLVRSSGSEDNRRELPSLSWR